MPNRYISDHIFIIIYCPYSGVCRVYRSTFWSFAHGRLKRFWLHIAGVTELFIHWRRSCVSFRATFKKGKWTTSTSFSQKRGYSVLFDLQKNFSNKIQIIVKYAIRHHHLSLINILLSTKPNYHLSHSIIPKQPSHTQFTHKYVLRPSITINYAYWNTYLMLSKTLYNRKTDP